MNPDTLVSNVSQIISTDRTGAPVFKAELSCDDTGSDRVNHVNLTQTQPGAAYLFPMTVELKSDDSSFAGRPTCAPRRDRTLRGQAMFTRIEAIASPIVDYPKANQGSPRSSTSTK